MEEEEESLFLSNARICDENHFISFFSAKNEKFGREKDKRERRFESLFGWKRFLLKELTTLYVTERVIAF